MKIYTKKGRLDYTEKRMVKALEKAAEANPDKFGADFKPATSKEELERLFKEHGVTDVAFTETKKDSAAGAKPNGSESSESATGSSGGDLDPFNAQAPNVRDYVTSDNGFKEETGSGSQSGPAPTSFPEPTSFEEAFHIPGVDEPKAETSGQHQQQHQPSGKAASPSGSQSGKQTKTPPLNSSFEDMDNSRKNKSTKKFAKYIVEIICTLCEKGLVWWGTKGITEAELVDLELKGEINLSLIVSLNANQEATVKDFFINQCLNIEHLSKFTDEEKKELADTLALVLLEKGAAPTPTQELLVVGVSIIGGKILSVLAMKAQSNLVLQQLKMLGGDGTGTPGQQEEDGEQREQPPEVNDAPPEVSDLLTDEDINNSSRLSEDDVPIGASLATAE